VPVPATAINLPRHSVPRAASIADVGADGVQVASDVPDAEGLQRYDRLPHPVRRDGELHLREILITCIYFIKSIIIMR
jgi:hypothetical protein